MNSKFVYINPENSLRKDIKYNILVKQILEKITDIPNYHDYRAGSIELLKMICNIIENNVNNKKKNKSQKIDKENLCCEVYNRLFDKISPQELSNIKNNIQYLIENKQIKKISFVKVCYSVVKNWFKKKFIE